MPRRADANTCRVMTVSERLGQIPNFGPARRGVGRLLCRSVQIEAGRERRLHSLLRQQSEVRPLPGERFHRRSQRAKELGERTQGP